MKKSTGNSEILKNQINIYNGTLWKPIEEQLKPKIYEINTKSWFSMTKQRNLKYNGNSYIFETDKLSEVKYRCKKKVILPTLEQKQILLSWMEAYRKMYNETLKLIKTKKYMTSDDNKRNKL